MLQATIVERNLTATVRGTSQRQDLSFPRLHGCLYNFERKDMHSKPLHICKCLSFLWEGKGLWGQGRTFAASREVLGILNNEDEWPTTMLRISALIDGCLQEDISFTPNRSKGKTIKGKSKSYPLWTLAQKFWDGARNGWLKSTCILSWVWIQHGKNWKILSLIFPEALYIKFVQLAKQRGKGGNI